MVNTKQHKQRRIGEFDVSLAMIDEYPDSVKQVMQNIIIIRAECLYHKDCIRYTGISKMFDVVKLGHDIPRYQMVANDHTGSVIANRLY